MYLDTDLSEKRVRKNSNGYLEAWYPEHPHNVDGWVLFHRLVMENHLGRFLEPDEVVHHVNEIKTCNEIWNLFLTNETEHTIVHRMGKRHRKDSTRRMSEKHQKIAKTRKRDVGGRFIAKD